MQTWNQGNIGGLKQQISHLCICQTDITACLWSWYNLGLITINIFWYMSAALVCPLSTCILTFRRNHLSVTSNLPEWWTPKGANGLLSHRFKAWYQQSLLLWQHNRNVCLSMCVSVCAGGLFDDQFQEFGIRHVWGSRREEREEKERKKREVNGRGRVEVEGHLNKRLFGHASPGQGLEGRK